MLKCTSSSRSSLVQVLPTWSSKSAPSLRARHFGFNMLKFKSSPRFSLVHILPTSSSKSAPSPLFLFNMLKCKSNSRFSLVHILPTWSSKSAPSPSFLFNMLKCKSSSRFSLVHIWPASSSKSAPSPSFLFNMLKCKSSSRFSLVHSLPTSSSKSAPSPSFLFNMQIELSLQSGAHLAGLLFQKCSEPVSSLLFLTCWSANRALATVLCALFVDNFCRSSTAPAEKTLYIILWRPRKPLYPEKHRISCPRLLVCEFTRSRPATLPNYFMMGGWSWWCGWHDDVVDMLMWSTWWCGWHDGGNASHENRFLTKLPLIIYIYIYIYTYQLTPMIPG